MELAGYSATPPCLRYEEAIKLRLVPVPEGFKWAGKTSQDPALLQRINAMHVSEEDDTQDQSGTSSARGDTEMDDDDSVNSEPEVSDLHSKGKERATDVAAPSSLANEDVLGLFITRLEALEVRLDRLEQLDQEILRELKRKRDPADSGDQPDTLQRRIVSVEPEQPEMPRQEQANSRPHACEVREQPSATPQHSPSTPLAQSSARAVLTPSTLPSSASQHAPLAKRSSCAHRCLCLSRS